MKDNYGAVPTLFRSIHHTLLIRHYIQCSLHWQELGSRCLWSESTRPPRVTSNLYKKLRASLAWCPWETHSRRSSNSVAGDSSRTQHESHHPLLSVREVQCVHVTLRIATTHGGWPILKGRHLSGGSDFDCFCQLAHLDTAPRMIPHGFASESLNSSAHTCI